MWTCDGYSGEAAREDAIAREDVAEASAEEAGEQPGEDAVAEDMAAPIGVFRLVAAGSDDHVELLGEEHVDHRRGRGGLVGQVAVGHHVNVGVDVGEHPADDVALALLLFGADYRARLCRDLASAVAAVVVVDVDGGIGQRCLEPGDGRADRRFLIVARQKHGDLRACGAGQSVPPRWTLRRL